MSQLILVRHGQAAFLSDNYDQLSELGQEQAKILGAYWAARNVTFDAMFTGPRVRQRLTGEIVSACYQRAGLPVPELQMLEEFDEYDADGIMKNLLPQLSAADERFAKLQTNFQQAETTKDKHKHFQHLFGAVTNKWLRGEILADEVESFQAFHARVRRGLAKVTAGAGSGRRVVVFSSGGAISVTTQIATQAPEQMVLEFNWRIRNCAISEIIFSPNRFTLDSFNAIPHLDEPRLHTYR